MRRPGHSHHPAVLQARSHRLADRPGLVVHPEQGHRLVHGHQQGQDHLRGQGHRLVQDHLRGQDLRLVHDHLRVQGRHLVQGHLQVLDLRPVHGHLVPEDHHQEHGRRPEDHGGHHRAPALRHAVPHLVDRPARGRLPAEHAHLPAEHAHRQGVDHQGRRRGAGRRDHPLVGLLVVDPRQGLHQPDQACQVRQARPRVRLGLCRRRQPVVRAATCRRRHRVRRRVTCRRRRRNGGGTSCRCRAASPCSCWRARSC